MNRQQVQGFTLLEILVVLAILSMLIIGIFQILQNGIRLDDISRNEINRLTELQRTFNIMEKDFSQMVQWYTRENGYALKAEFHQLQSKKEDVIFISNNRINPLGIFARSELQFVGYRLYQRRLERLNYSSRVQSESMSPSVQILLNNVSGFRLRFYNDGVWKESWDDETQLPQCIEITLELDEFSKLTRFFLIREFNG